MSIDRLSIVRGLSTVSVLAFLGTLGYFLMQLGYSRTRVIFFAGLGGLAVLGEAGVIFQRELVAVVGVCGLLVIGFWQAVLWVYIFPVVTVLLVATIVIAKENPTPTLAAE
ncbi:hypothetical protein ACFR9U_15800 [Halorientalis brevis]|uniref:Uncharacterized protein n=1 Tax=Halorientalis brevis TaxID=1126241 RepID=A0ABD6CGU5_9EURY|nr:hypothetical protein [Halorientalis brevis]